MNRYLKDRAMRRGRNPYGSRGGYVSSDRARGGRGRDRGYDMAEYDSGYDMRDYRGRDYNEYLMYDERDRESYGDSAYDMRDYRRGGSRSRDSRDYGYDYGEDDKEYKEELKKWIDKLKKKDRYGMTYDQVMQQAKSIGVKFEEYSELEFYAIYLAMVSDYKDISNDPSVFFKMAKDFLEDDDVAMKGSEKVCAYLYEIVLAED